eukprot:2210232-Rhodomonas_salina.1
MSTSFQLDFLLCWGALYVRSSVTPAKAEKGLALRKLSGARSVPKVTVVAATGTDLILPADVASANTG